MANLDEFTVESQAEALSRVRALTPGLTPDVLDDEGLLRFLIARQGSVERTSKMVAATLAWRQKMKLDTQPLYPDGPSTFALRGFDFFLPDTQNSVNDPVFKALFENTGGFAIHKTDRLGNPVVIERSGFHDAVGVVKNVTVDNAIDFHIRCNEFIFTRLAPALSKRAGKTIGKVTIIIDCRGLGWQHFHLPALRYLMAFEAIDQDNYPERLCRAFVVNAPAVFTTIWAVLKRGLDKRILDKVFILGKNYEEELQKFIAPENLPDFLGGKCTCSHMPNGCVPCLQPERLAALDRLKQYVSARDSFRLDIVVEEVGSALPYSFTTKDYNIQFGITYRESVDHEAEEVLEPIQMRDSHVTPVQGRIVASKAGVYTFIWDNTHSFLKGKYVSYAVDVETPEGTSATASTASLLDARSNPALSNTIVSSESAPL